MAFDYDKERTTKTNHRLKLLGKPWFLIILWIGWTGLMVFPTSYLTSAIRSIIVWLNVNNYGLLNGQITQTEILKQGWSLSNLTNFSMMKIVPVLFFPVLFILSILLVSTLWKTWIKNKDTNKNQYGNDRLTSEREVLRQYPQVSDRGYEFKGYGGVPVHHTVPTTREFITSHPLKYINSYLLPQVGRVGQKLPWVGDKIKQLVPDARAVHGFYAIDQTTVNSLIVGITRSGKGETLVMPLVDLLSRAKMKSSMVVNDPKGELYQMSYETLRKRGYNVQVLNIQKTDFSMSYNPLQNIINYAKEGYYDEVQQEVNTLSSSIYVDPNAKDKFWQNSSINLLNSLVLAIIDYAKRNNRWDEVTMDNVLHMMTNLGGQEVGVNSDGDIVLTQDEAEEQGIEYRPNDERFQAIATKPKLIVYFEKLDELNAREPSPFRQMAHDYFAQSKFAGDETSGNIYSSAMEGNKIYQQTNIAKLTSLNSVNFESIGFPRMFKIKMPEFYRFHTAIVTFETTSGKRIESRTQLIDSIGMLNYAVKEKLPNNFVIKLSFNFHKNPIDMQDDVIILNGYKEYSRSGFGNKLVKKDPYTHEPLLKKIRLTIQGNKLKGKPTEMKMDYSESPVALFMVTPPNNPSYNQLPAFAIDQIFNTIYNAASNNGRKSFNRVHFILDEFGNLPTIAHMDTKVSIGLGQNMLFDIVVQNLEQLKINYSADQAATIESNCANLLYILTESKDTARSISERIGKQTVSVETVSGQATNINSVNISNQYVAQDILSPTELMRFMGGEMVVLRSVYRQDQKGRSVSAMPIFDHGKTEMIYRYKFLTDEFNDKTTLSDIGIKALHQTLDLATLRINYDDAYQQLIHNEPKKLADVIGDSQMIKEAVETPIFKDFSNPDMNDIHTVGSDLPMDAVLNDLDLQDEEFLKRVMDLLALELQALSPEELNARITQQLFDDTANWWKHDRHNNWDYIGELFKNHDAELQLFKDSLESMKERRG